MQKDPPEPIPGDSWTMPLEDVRREVEAMGLDVDRIGEEALARFLERLDRPDPEAVTPFAHYYPARSLSDVLPWLIAAVVVAGVCYAVWGRRGKR